MKGNCNFSHDRNNKCNQAQYNQFDCSRNNLVRNEFIGLIANPQEHFKHLNNRKSPERHRKSPESHRKSPLKINFELKKDMLHSQFSNQIMYYPIQGLGSIRTRSFAM